MPIVRLCFLIQICLISSLYSQEVKFSKAEKEAVYQLLESQQLVQKIQSSIEAQLVELKKNHPTMPASTFKTLRDSSSAEVIKERLATAWAGHFTASELNQLRVFLASSAGKKYVELNPSLTADMMATGSLLGIRIYELLTEIHPDAFTMDEKMQKFKAQMVQARDKARKGTKK